MIPKEKNDFLGLKIVEINPTELCNRTCSFCPRSLPNVFPNRNLHMEVSTIRKLIEDLISHGYKGRLHITGFGEPFLNPNIIEIIKLCSVFKTRITTNGDKLISDIELFKNVINAGLNNIVVSCYDGKKQVDEVYEFLSGCSIEWSIREYTDNGTENLYQQYNFTNRGGLMYDSNPNQRQCFYPFYKAFIDYDGTVRLCCNDWQRKHNLGNILLDDFYSIWMSDDLKRIRKELHKGNRMNVISCSSCDIDGRQHGKESYDTWINYGI